jgi:hypothetical protein
VSYNEISEWFTISYLSLPHRLRERGRGRKGMGKGEKLLAEN